MLAALLGLGAVIAGRIVVRRKVVLFEGAVAFGIATVTLVVLAGVVAPELGLALALALLTPYVAVSALPPSKRRRLPLPTTWRAWLASAVEERLARTACGTRSSTQGWTSWGRTNCWRFRRHPVSSRSRVEPLPMWLV